MKSRNIKHLIWLILLFGVSVAHAQTKKPNQLDSSIFLTEKSGSTKLIDGGFRSEQDWRNTGAVFTISGEDLGKTTAGNLLNALHGRIPGLTVVSSHGEPGYDNPTLYVRGQSSWNVAGNQVVIFLDGFQVDMNALSALSTSEIETITLLKDAAALAIYGLNGGAGVLSVRTKEGTKTGKTKIEVSAKYGAMHTIALPKVMDAYGYVSAYNQALQNDGLPIKYYNTELYKANDDPFHSNVNWYDKLLTNRSALQDYNISFRGGTEKARFYVLGGYTSFSGAYKDADIIDMDFGTNAKYQRLNLRANLDLQLNKNLSVKASVSGITEDRNTPSGFTAASVFSNLMKIPAAAFPVKNLDGSWGNSSVYNFNPVQLLRRHGIYNSHTRYLQTNVNFQQKLDAFVSGLALSGGVSFSNVYAGIYDKKFAVPSYELSKDAYDNPVLDANGIVYKVVGTASESITDEGNDHWNRTSAQFGFDYGRSFGKNTFTGMLKATRSSYVHDGQTYAVVDQGLRGFVTYDYAKKYIADLSFSYLGSGDFESGHRYGLFPAIGLGWIVSNEDFLENNSVISFLKARASYGLTANTNESSRFLYERWGSWTENVYTLGTTDAGRNGRTEGAYANADFTWEAKQSANVGIDATLFKKLNATVDVFREKRTGILEAPVGIPDFTGFNFRNTNTGEVVNKGFELNLQFRDKIVNGFEYNAGVSMAYARNEITKKAENPQPYDYMYQKGYRIGQMRGLESAGFYQVTDFDAAGNLNAAVVKSTYGQVKPGDLKYVDQNGDGLISDYDKVPMNFAKLPEITAAVNLGFKYAGFDFEAFLQGVMNRTVSLLDDAFDYTHPLANNNNITVFSNNPWTPQTANTATSPRLSTLVNNNNNQSSDFWLRNGNFFKLRSVELGYTLPKAGFLKKIENARFYVIGNNLLGNEIEGLEPERLSMGYPLMKTVTFGVKAKF